MAGAREGVDGRRAREEDSRAEGAAGRTAAWQWAMRGPGSAAGVAFELYALAGVVVATLVVDGAEKEPCVVGGSE
jgi:hypothetical protein